MFSELTKDEVLDYCSEVPLALAFERLIELRILRSFNFGSPILDLGSGDGIFAKYLLKGRNIELAIDPSAIETEFAPRSGHIYDLICQALGNDLPFKSNSVATIFSNSVLEHIHELDSVLHEVRRVLNPNGVFVVTVPTERFEKYSIISLGLASLRLRSLDLRFRRLYNRFWNHYHAYSIPQWEELLARHGFMIIQSVTYGTRVSTAVNDLLVPFGIVGKLRRLAGAPWVISRRLRKVVLRPLHPFLCRAVNRPISGDALVCLVLRTTA